VKATRSDGVRVAAADTGVAAVSSALVHEQRQESLDRANEVRAARAILKKELASGRVRLEDVLAQTPAFAMTARVSELLLAVPGFGSVRATRLLAHCQIPYRKSAASLSARQRDALIAHLRTDRPPRSKETRRATIEPPQRP
jgi:hypothetical protein